MDIGAILGNVASAATKAFTGGGGLDIGKIAGGILGGGAGAAGGGFDLGKIAGDIFGGLGGKDAKAGAFNLSSIFGGLFGGGVSHASANPLKNLTNTIDLTSVARSVNPNLPADQVNIFDQISGGARSLLSGDAFKMLSGNNDPSRAGQFPGDVNHALARRNADKALSQIDWSKDTIGLWVPGTGSHSMNPQFKNSLGNGVSTVTVDYPADLDMLNGVSTGMETTRLILEEASRRGKKVVLGGHSQGAWVAGEVMANKGMSDKVSKAVLYGHPSIANAQFDGGVNPKVREINNPDDPYTNRLDLVKMGAYLLGQRRPDGSDQHGYNYGSEAAWLRS